MMPGTGTRRVPVSGAVGGAYSRVCRGSTCPDRIVLARTESGAWQPFNVDPDPDGGFVLDRIGGSFLSRAVGLWDADRDRYMQHHATCPDVAEFRTGGGT